MHSTVNDLIFTGIPRSGTSYLCALLHKVNNCVAINEPYKMSFYLADSALPSKVLDFHSITRADILNQKPIKNKLLAGKLIEDTAIIEQFEYYLPDVNRDDFLLCSKNTLGYLARLTGFQSIMPNAPIFACIRNPLDTIASWKQSFPHLESASCAIKHIIGGMNDPHLSDWQKEQLITIAKAPSIAYRRAMLWTYFATWIEKNKRRVNIVHYETMVLNPTAILQSIFSASSSTFPLTLGSSPVLPSNIRMSKRILLDDEDKAAIQKVCTPIAQRFDYDIGN